MFTIKKLRICLEIKEIHHMCKLCITIKSFPIMIQLDVHYVLPVVGFEFYCIQDILEMQYQMKIQKKRNFTSWKFKNLYICIYTYIYDKICIERLLWACGIFC